MAVVLLLNGAMLSTGFSMTAVSMSREEQVAHVLGESPSPCAALHQAQHLRSHAKLGAVFLHVMRCEKAGSRLNTCGGISAHETTTGLEKMLGSWLVSLCGSRQHTMPYLHLKQDNVVGADFAHRMVNEITKRNEDYIPIMYPGACPDHKCHGKTVSGQAKDGIGLVSMLNHSYQPGPYLAAFRDAVHSGTFKRILWERLRLGEIHSYIRPEQTYVATTLFQDSWGYDISPHPDAGFKLASFFFPMPDPSEPERPLGTQICTLKRNHPKAILPGPGWQDWENFDCVDTGFDLGQFMAFRVTSDRVAVPNRSYHAVKFWSGPKKRMMFRGHVCNPFRPSGASGSEPSGASGSEVAARYDISERGMLRKFRQQMKAFSAMPWQRSEILRQLPTGKAD
jgi:hypothetical protein